jgi:acetyl-CoA C-acetyltransferase
MREVAVIGIGQTKVDEHWDKSLKELTGEAIIDAMRDAGRDYADAVFVGNMMSGSANKQQQLGALVSDWVGLRYTEAMKIESACGSGASAFRMGLMAIASGEMDCVIVSAVEKMTDSPLSEITAHLATAADADYEADMGVSFVALNALIMNRYMHEYGWKKEDFAAFSINAHANGVHNPKARFQDPITLESYLKAGMICPPINLMDASPVGDGAAAAVLVPADSIQLSTRPVVVVAGSAAATDTIGVHHRSQPLWLSAAEKSSKEAYRQSGFSPSDMDLFEAHDAFSIMAALSLEASGFAEQGQGPRIANDGEILPGGRIPIATRGGLKARGHPVGATGLYQITEVVQQLWGEAGDNQIAGARVGMAQNIGGSGSNIVTHILKIK